MGASTVIQRMFEAHEKLVRLQSIPLYGSEPNGQEAAWKAVGGNTFAGSSPVASA